MAYDAVGTTALPVVVLDIESGAGSDELLDHGRVALPRGQDERSVPAENSAAGLNGVRPMQSAQRPYPSLVLTSSPAPAAMSCSTMSVWPFEAAEMRAVVLQVPSAVGSDSTKTIHSAQRPYALLVWTSSPAPAAMSCSTTSVWPHDAAKMSAVSLPRCQLPR